MAERDRKLHDEPHMWKLVFACPQCKYNCVGQVIFGLDRCPECGQFLPRLDRHPSPVMLWHIWVDLSRASEEAARKISQINDGA